MFSTLLATHVALTLGVANGGTTTFSPKGEVGLNFNNDALPALTLRVDYKNPLELAMPTLSTDNLSVKVQWAIPLN